MASFFAMENIGGGGGGVEQDRRSSETPPKRGKKNRKSTQKKEPQRGLGVAQLERLRLQERWKKISDYDQLQTLQTHQNPPPPPPFQFHQIPFTYLDHPNGAVSVPFARFPPVNESGFAFSPYRFSNGGFGSGGATSIVQHVNVPDFQNLNRFQNSKELSSSQMHCVSGHCEICFKKKRLDRESYGFNKERAVNGLDSLGLSLGRNSAIDEEEVEVVAVHRKKGNNGGGNVMMEYEFFPASASTSSSVAAQGGGKGVGDEASIDFSLKLSW